MNVINNILGYNIKKKKDVSKDSRQRLHFDEVNGKRVSFYIDWHVKLPFTLKQWEKQVDMWVKYASTYENGVSKLESAPILGLGIYSEYAIQIANRGNEKLKRKFNINSDYQLWNGKAFAYGIEKEVPKSMNPTIADLDVGNDRRIRRWW